MNADKMTARVADGTGASHVRQWMTQTSPKASGRIAGACYLAIFVAGEIFSVLVPNLGLLNTIDSLPSGFVSIRYQVYQMVSTHQLVCRDSRIQSAFSGSFPNWYWR
jgi:hypothetical protein